MAKIRTELTQSSGPVDSGALPAIDTSAGRPLPAPQLMPYDVSGWMELLSQLESQISDEKATASKDADEWEQQLRHANALADSGKLVEAIKLYGKLKSSRQLDARPLCFRGVALARLGVYEDALTDLDAALNCPAGSMSTENILSDRTWLIATCPEASFRQNHLSSALLTSGFEWSAKVCISRAAAKATEGQFAEALAQLDLAACRPHDRHDLVPTLEAKFRAGLPHWEAFEAPIVRFRLLTSSPEVSDKRLVTKQTTPGQTRQPPAEDDSDLSRQSLALRSSPTAQHFISEFADLLKDCATAITSYTRQRHTELFAELVTSKETKWQLRQRYILLNILEGLRRVHEGEYLAAETVGNVRKGEKVGLTCDPSYKEVGRFVAAVTTEPDRSIRRVQFPPIDLVFSRP